MSICFFVCSDVLIIGNQAYDKFQRHSRVDAVWRHYETQRWLADLQ